MHQRHVIGFDSLHPNGLERKLVYETHRVGVGTFIAWSRKKYSKSWQLFA
jgi:hypothetical protein